MHAVFRNAGFLIAIAASVALTGGCAKTHLDSGPADRHPAEEKKITVARVNGTAISLYSLLNMTNRMNAINEKASVAETPEETRKKALDQLIFRELAYQEAVREGLHVEDQLVDREMNRFIMSVGHEDGFNEYLKSQNMTAVEVRAEIERALLLQRIAAREVMEKVTVTDEDVRKEYELHQSAFVTPEKVTVTDLVMTSGGEEALRKAEELLAKTKNSNGVQFRDLISDGTFTVQTRQIFKDKDPELYNEARKLKVGERSGVIQAGNAYHILQLDAYVPEKQLSFEEIKGPLKDRLKAQRQVQRFQEWEGELKKDAKIEILDASLR